MYSYKCIGKDHEVGWKDLEKSLKVFSKIFESQIKRYKTKTNGRDIYGESLRNKLYQRC